MYQKFTKKALILAAAIFLLWLTAGYLVPIGAPFLLGAGLALAAEPMVRLLDEKLRLPRFAATGIGVSLVFILSIAAVIFLLGLLVRQLRSLSGILPQLEYAVAQGTALLRNRLLSIAQKMPGSIHSVMTPLVEKLFSGSSALFEQAAMRIPQIATGLLGGLSEGMLGMLTGIISGYMISSRLPALRQWLRARLPSSFREKFLPALKGFRRALGGWIVAELKLAGIAFVMLSIGFFLLQIPNSLLWAGLITLVDAFPILGVGTVLVPWSLMCLLQGEVARGVGLLGIYAVIWLVRSVLEPKLVGKELGLDPLVTLIAIYAGFRLWGILGMLLAPILAMAVTQIAKGMNA